MEQISPKKDIKKELVKLLKEKGPEDPQAKALLAEWISNNEKELSERPESPSRMEMNLRRGRLYFEAGYIDEAYDNFSAAATQADNEGNKELFDAIMSEMDEMDNKLG